MSLSPNQIRRAEFDSRRRGYDREQVHEFLEAAAASLEATRNEAMTIESRFRAAAARVRELTMAADERAAAGSDVVRDPVDDSHGAASVTNAGDEPRAAAPVDAEQVEQVTPRHAHEESESEHRVDVDQRAELERQRVELERAIAERSEELRADQDRLRAVTETLQNLTDQRFEPTATADPATDSNPGPAPGPDAGPDARRRAGPRTGSDPGFGAGSEPGEHSVPIGVQPTDEPAADQRLDQRLEAPRVIVDDDAASGSEDESDDGERWRNRPVDEPGSNPR